MLRERGRRCATPLLPASRPLQLEGRRGGPGAPRGGGHSWRHSWGPAGLAPSGGPHPARPAPPPALPSPALAGLAHSWEPVGVPGRMGGAKPRPHRGPFGRGDAPGGCGTGRLRRFLPTRVLPTPPRAIGAFVALGKLVITFLIPVLPPCPGPNLLPGLCAGGVAGGFREGFIRLLWPGPRRTARSQTQRLWDARPCRCLPRGSCKGCLQLQFLVLFKGRLRAHSVP